MTPTDRADGYAVVVEGGRVQVHLTKRWLDDALRVETERTLEAGRWSHVAVTYDGSRLASGVTVYVDRRPEPVRALLDELNQSFDTKESLRIEGGGAGRFRGRVDEVRVYDDVPGREEVETLAMPESAGTIAGTPNGRRTRAQSGQPDAFFLAERAPAGLRAAPSGRPNCGGSATGSSRPSRRRWSCGRWTPPGPRSCWLTGSMTSPGSACPPGAPGRLPPLPSRARADRLGFARWLVDPANPLTARVAVNRLWQMAFGSGLVRTAEDFGTQGEPPSHPELLDWLATEFVRTGWDVKALQRLVVTSATYRQSSRVTPYRRKSDPEKRLLSRGPRFRLPAEMIRDAALAAGGLLVERQGGPSVKPYQPARLWNELADTDQQPGYGPDLYRCRLCTFWKRTVTHSTMVTFDTAGREACVIREVRTDTLLQALALSNDVTCVEAARALAARAIKEGDGTPAGRLTLAFRLALARRPRPDELKVLTTGYDTHRAHYRANPAAASIERRSPSIKTGVSQ